MSTATVIPLRPATEARPAEAFSAEDVTRMLNGAIRYWASMRFRCPLCRESESGVCHAHEDSGTHAFTAGLLRDVFTADDELATQIVALARAIRKNRKGEAAIAGQGMAVLVHGQEGETR